MKNRHIFLVLILVQLSGITYAQHVTVGLKTGLNLAELSGTVNVDTKAKAGMILGGYLQVPLSNQTYYHPEIMYSAQGSNYTYHQSGPASPSAGETKVKLSYLNVLPLSIKLYFSKAKDINLQLGPQFGFLLSAKEEGEVDGDAVDEDLSDIMKSMDISIAMGLGIDLPVGLNFGGRLNYGLSDISDLSKDYTTGFTRPSLTNVVFQFHVGYTFGKNE